MFKIQISEQAREVSESKHVRQASEHAALTNERLRDKRARVGMHTEVQNSDLNKI